MIDLSSIKNPVANDIKSISGNIQGIPITVTRLMSGWTPVIEIILDGVRVHSSEALPEERKQFDDLLERAMNEKHLAITEKRSDFQRWGIMSALFPQPKAKP